MNLKKLFLSLGTCLMGLTGACGGNDSIPSAGSAEFAGALDSADVQLLDVRTPDEFAEGHLPDAVNINVQDSAFIEKAAAALSTERPVYVYCRSGRRSLKAARLLAAKGYSVVNLAGGILDWEAKGFPVVR